ATTGCCRERFGSAPLPRPRSPPRRSPPPKFGGCAAVGASPSRSTCATPRSSFAASATCVSPASHPGQAGTRSPVSMAPAMVARCACTRIFRTIARACSSCWAAPMIARRLPQPSANGRRNASRRPSPKPGLLPLCFARRRDGQTTPRAGRAPTPPPTRSPRSAKTPPRGPRATPPPPPPPARGVRVLDLTRVIAGPVCGRALAAHGAEVMRITAPHLPGLPELDIDTGRGKLSAALDLRAAEDRERLTGLLRQAHVFVQGYRPGGLAALGFAPEACAELRPGIVVVTLSAYGHQGPWALRRGFDSLVQNANGLNVAEAEAAGVPAPRELPAQALDHASGYLMAFGAMMALARKAREGGSWHVRVSLAQTGHWLAGLGRVS